MEIHYMFKMEILYNTQTAWTIEVQRVELDE